MGYLDYQKRQQEKRKWKDEMDDKRYVEYHLSLLEPVFLTADGNINHKATMDYVTKDNKVVLNRLETVLLFERVWERRIEKRKRLESKQKHFSQMRRHEP